MKKGRIGRIVLGVVLALLVLLNVVAAFHAYKFTHFTDKQVVRLNEHHISGMEKIKTLLFGIDMSRPVDFAKPSQPYYHTDTIQSNVKLECWDLRTDSTSRKGTVIIFHGYRGNKSSMIDRSDEFLKMGYNTLLVDFMGSGGSEGNATTIGYTEAEEVRAAYDYVVGTKVDGPIYLFGTSMGAAAIMKAVNDDPTFLPAGLILECPFGSMLKTVSVRVKMMGLHTFPTAYLLMFWGGLENGFWAFGHNPEEYAKSIELPVLLMWGEQDERVSKAEIDSIYSNIKRYKQLKTFPLCRHEDYLPKYHDEWVNTVDSFLVESKRHIVVND